MNSRRFTDTTGTEWRVRATVPSSRGAGALPDAYSRGWLVFESSAGLVKRLAPIPEGWETADESSLEQLSRAAVTGSERGDGPTVELMKYEPARRLSPEGPFPT
jgi:hypothetical protein